MPRLTESKYAARVTLLAIAALLAGCSKPEVSAKEPDPPTAAPQAAQAGVVTLGPDAPELKEMKIESVRKVTVAADEVSAPAKIEVNPNRVGHALLPVPGRIEQVLVKLGDTVTQGQPIVTIESPNISEEESGWVQADVTVRQAQLAIAKAEADLARLTDLFAHDAVAKKEVLSAETTLALAKSGLDQAQSGKEQARRRLEHLGLKAGEFQQRVTVSAPISGKVLEISVVAGEYHNEVNAPLLKIVDLSRVWVSSDVPESAIRFCRIGGMADLELIAYPDRVFHGRVTRIADIVDADTRTIKVTAELDNPQGTLRPEMFGTLRYAAAMVQGVWIPEAAVVQSGGKDLVFVEQSKGRFLAKTVELGKRSDAGYAVRSGLTEGERVVTAGAVYLKAGL